jgi:hypothetical protein
VPEDDSAAVALAKLEAYKTESIKTSANAFVEGEVKAGRMFPSEKDACASLFQSLALMEDGAALESFKAMQAARKPHGLTAEMVDAEANKVLLASGNSITEEREKELLNKTPLGRSALVLVENGDSKTAKAK